MRRLFTCLAVAAIAALALPVTPVGADARGVTTTYENVVIHTWFRCSALGGAGTTVTWWTSATNYDDTAHQVDIRIADYSSIGADVPDSALLQPGQSLTATASLPWPVNMATVAEVDGNVALGTTYVFGTVVTTDPCGFDGALDATPIEWGDEGAVTGADSALLATVATGLVASGVALLGLRRRPA